MEPMIMTTQQHPLIAALAPHDGGVLPGGCDDCSAYQSIDTSTGGHNVALVRVHHDDWCPTLRRHQEARRKLRQQQWKRPRSPKAYRPQDGDNR